MMVYEKREVDLDVKGSGRRSALRWLALGACVLACSESAPKGAVAASNASVSASESAESRVPSLHEKYAAFFPIGAAVDPTSLDTHAALLERHFNSITTENEMKFESVEKTEGNFDYASADRTVAFARAHGMKVRGHTLVWHRQTPPWVFEGSAGAKAPPELLLARMRNHIQNVVTHFKGSVYAWDVVNEAVMDNGEYRTEHEEKEDQRSPWYGILGTSYIAEAFKAAHAADPNAKLFYNDYREYIPVKRQAIYEMLKGLLAAGVPVHGVGLQCHLNIEPAPDPNNPQHHQTVAELEETIKLFSSLGLDVQVTELDLSLYVPGVTYTQGSFYTPATFTPDLEQRQADRYGEFFALFRKYQSVITGVTFWGIADDNSWLSEFSSGRRDFPLLFGNDHQPKKALERIMDF
jgi:endo-1,4-beta-xylanase